MMKPPKIDVCIEGYDTDQTDFYINNLIEQHDSDTKRLAQLQKENAELRADFDSLMSVMKQMMSKLDTVDSRLVAIETALGITAEQRRAEPQEEKSVSPKEIERQDIDRAEVAERLDGIRNSIGSLRAILNK